jgi:hypothetical protein
MRTTPLSTRLLRSQIHRQRLRIRPRQLRRPVQLFQLRKVHVPRPKILSMRHLVNPRKWNKYAYTINNPLRYFDPDGMEELEIQLRAYIPQQTMVNYRGDNRGPTTSQAVTSRTSVTFRIETDRSKRPPDGYPPLLAPATSKAGETVNAATGNRATQTEGLPGVTSAKYDSKTAMQSSQSRRTP